MWAMSSLARFRRRDTSARAVTPAAILETAFTLVAEAGLDELDLGTLAERLSCHPQEIHDQLGGRPAVAEAVVEKAIGQVPLPTLPADDRAWQDALAALAAAMRATLLPLPGVARRVAESISVAPEQNVLVAYACTVLRLGGHRDPEWAAKLFVRAVCSEISLDPDPAGDSGSEDFHNAMALLLGGLAVTR